MPINLFSFVDMFSKTLTTAERLLDKGVAHATVLGVDERTMLDWRLIDDMATLRFQLTVVCNFAQQWPARVAGLPLPADVGEDLDVAGFRAAIAQVRAYLAVLTAEQFDGRDDVPITFQIGTGLELTLPAGRWLTVFANSNLFFHLTTAYGILRAKGVPLGKVDLFAAGL